MELYAPDAKLAMTDSHNLIILGCCGDFQALRNSCPLDNQRVVAGGGESLRHILEKIFSIVTDARGLTMHQFIGTDNFSAKRLSDGLMTEAYAQQGNFSGPAFDRLKADTCFVGIARSGRDDQAVKSLEFEIINTYRVIAHHFLLRTQLAKVLDDVVGEGIVVIDDEEAHPEQIKLYGISLLAGTLLEAEGMEANKSTGILGSIIALIIIHGCNFHVVEGLVGFTANGGDISFVKF